MIKLCFAKNKKTNFPENRLNFIGKKLILRLAKIILLIFLILRASKKESWEVLFPEKPELESKDSLTQFHCCFHVRTNIWKDIYILKVGNSFVNNLMIHEQCQCYHHQWNHMRIVDNLPWNLGQICSRKLVRMSWYPWRYTLGSLLQSEWFHDQRQFYHRPHYIPHV